MVDYKKERNGACAQWEADLVDLLDGTLLPEREAALRAHARQCSHCAALLRESTSGREWARLLHGAPPAAPAALVGKILAQTSELPYGGAVPLVGAAYPLAASESLAVPYPAFALRQRAAGALLTAAMALFSIALTLSVVGRGWTGAQLGELGAAAVHAPDTLSATAEAAERQFFGTKKQVVSYYDNLPLVREVEATVDFLRSSTATASSKAKGSGPSARRGLMAPPSNYNPAAVPERTIL